MCVPAAVEGANHVCPRMRTHDKGVEELKIRPLCWLCSTNGAFCVPMPRGCVLVMTRASYAANAVKHCVRPADMTGKSASLILRRINPAALQQAHQHYVDETLTWLRSLSIEESQQTVQLEQQPTAPATPALRKRPRAAAQRHTHGGTLLLDRSDTGSSGASRKRARHSGGQLQPGVAVQLALLTVVRRVEAAERTGVDVTAACSSASVCFDVVDSLVDWCEQQAMLEAPRKRQRQGAFRGLLLG